MKNVRDAGFSRKRDGNAGSGPPLPDPGKGAESWGCDISFLVKFFSSNHLFVYELLYYSR